MIGERLTGPDDQFETWLRHEELPTDDLTDDVCTFYRFSDDRRVVGFGGFERYGRKALLRSIVTAPDVRGRGFGRMITRDLLDRLSSAGVTDAYLLTTNATTLFGSLGFTVTDRSIAPAEILATKQATTLCPSSASLLSRQTKW